MQDSGAELERVARAICAANKLTYIGSVGRGSFKRVFEVGDRAGHRLALKVMRSQSNVARTRREIEAIRRCNHPSIGKILSQGTHHFGGTRFAFMMEEFYAGGTLSELLRSRGTLPAGDVVRLGGALISVLAHLERQGLVHRDIKPDNIMFREGDEVPVLVDFGLVRDLGADSLTQTWLPCGPGTPYFAAPEQLNNQKHLIDWRTDQFALGVVLAVAGLGFHPYQFPGEPPFHDSTVERVARRSSRRPGLREDLDRAGLAVLMRMTEGWPVGRFRAPALLLAAWAAQNSR